MCQNLLWPARGRNLDRLGAAPFQHKGVPQPVGFRDVKIYTRKGDAGRTGLLYGGRVDKDDIRTEVYGTLDETVSALGIARAGGLETRVEEVVIRLQKEMFVVGAQLATAPEHQDRLQEGVSKVSASMTEQAEADIDQLVGKHPIPQEFILPGETPGAAGLDLARSIIRRAERAATRMNRTGLVPDPEILRYLNRASDLLFVLARFEEAERGLSPQPSRQKARERT
jgi:cob(I)alamin adenosyltransferase